MEGFPNGWSDSVEIAVFEKDREAWARDQARGEAMAGFVPGALYDATYGELWFNCAHNRFCVLKAHTAVGDTREQIARSLAQLAEARLR